MKEHPILFSAPLVRAILAGQKTVTRRLVRELPGAKGLHDHTRDPSWRYDRPPDAPSLVTDQPPGTFSRWPFRPCPYGAPGDHLWVRESFNVTRTLRDSEGVADDELVWPGRLPKEDPRGRRAFDDWSVAYAADADDAREWAWRHSIHQPRWASRLTLAVEDVRVERLHAIDEADARAEGVDAIPVADVPRNGTLSRVADFAQLWERINGKRAPWASNPWVWRVQFRRLP